MATGTQTDGPEPITLPEDGTKRDLKPNEIYRAHVNNTTEYGIFVNVAGAREEVSGLVHISNLPPFTTLADFSVGDELLVELAERKPNGDIAFTGVKAPEVAPDAPAAQTNFGDNTEELQEEIAETRELLEDFHTQTQAAQARVTNQVSDAIRFLRGMKQDGYEPTAYETSVTDETVELRIELAVPSDGGSD